MPELKVYFLPAFAARQDRLNSGGPVTVPNIFGDAYQTHPKADKLCIACNKPGPLRCTGCYAGGYCSRKCQTSDWKVHRTICKRLKRFEKRGTKVRARYADRPEEERPVRAILFPQDRTSLRFIWIRIKGDGWVLSQQPSLPEFHVLRASTGEKLHKPEVVNWQERMDAHKMGSGLILWEMGAASDGPDWANKSVMALGKPGRIHGRYGPVLAAALHPQHLYAVDITMRDYRHVIDHLQNYKLNPMVVDLARFPDPVMHAILVSSEESFLEREDGGDIEEPAEAVIAPLRSPYFNLPCKYPFLFGLRWYMRYADIHDNKTHLKVRPIRYLGWVQHGMRLRFRHDEKARRAAGDIPDAIETSPGPMPGAVLVFHASGRALDLAHLQAFEAFFISLSLQPGSRKQVTKEDFQDFWETFRQMRARQGKPVPYDVPDPYHLERPCIASLLEVERTEGRQDADQLMLSLDKWHETYGWNDFQETDAVLERPERSARGPFARFSHVVCPVHGIRPMVPDM